MTTCSKSLPEQADLSSDPAAGIDRLWPTFVGRSLSGSPWNVQGKRPGPPSGCSQRVKKAALGKGCPLSVLPKQSPSGPRTIDEIGVSVRRKKGKGEKREGKEGRKSVPRGDSATAAQTDSLRIFLSLFPFFPLPLLYTPSTFAGQATSYFPRTYEQKRRLCTDLLQCDAEKPLVSPCGDTVSSPCPKNARPGVRRKNAKLLPRVPPHDWW